ncbi:coagulation factor XIII B chain-like isoform X2 [Dendrobates tinctorius]|uniref:coagulation factor XIII B chain-like isoform X2 n=1 Tax=Dendrobates tinctorius TaxID=92724 RepID=UPI003CCA08AF
MSVLSLFILFLTAVTCHAAPKSRNGNEDSCEGAPEVLNAFVIQEQKTYKHGESAEFTCKDNYGFSGGDSAKCVKGKWMNVPKCVVTACNQPPTVLNAKINGQTKNIYASGDIVMYSCNKDYSLEQSLTGEAKCENTVWINLPVCRRIGDQCGPPPTVQFGDTVDIRKNHYKTREYVEYKCKNYYLLQGNKKVQCMNGVWGEAPVCLEPCTAKEKSMEDNNIHLRWSGEKKIYLTHGDQTEFGCKPGFESPPNTQMRITCEHGKLEYPKCYKKGFCVLQQAAMIDNNIHYNVSTVLDNGQIIKFQCNGEMTPEKGLEATCRSGNIQYPKCTVARSCKAPEIQNGFLKTPEDSYDSGHSAEFECNKDHIKNNLVSPKCENGKWTHHPVCYSPCEVSSEDLSASNIQLVSTDIGKSYKHGAELQVSCKQGYKRPNQLSFFIECNDGTFKYLRCISGKTCRIDQDDLDGNNLELDEVHNTDVYYEIGETIKFKCRNGFSHRDHQPTGTCAEKELIYPKCIGSCKAPEIQNGFLKTPEDSYDSGHSAEFECNKDHIKNNLVSPKCENGKWTHHPVCYSPCEVSSEDLSASNIQLVSTDIGKSYKHGAELQVSCKQGYKRPNQLSFFIECNDGTFKYLRCISGKTCRIDQDDLDGNNLELDEVHNTDVYYEIGETIKFKCRNGFSHRDHQPTGTCAEKELIYPKCIESSV